MGARGRKKVPAIETGWGVGVGELQEGNGTHWRWEMCTGGGWVLEHCVLKPGWYDSKFKNKEHYLI